MPTHSQVYNTQNRIRFPPTPPPKAKDWKSPKNSGGFLCISNMGVKKDGVVFTEQTICNFMSTFIDFQPFLFNNHVGS